MFPPNGSVSFGQPKCLAKDEGSATETPHYFVFAMRLLATIPCSVYRREHSQCHTLTHFSVVDQSLQAIALKDAAVVVDLVNGQLRRWDGLRCPQQVAAGEQSDREDHPPIVATL